MEWRLLGAGFEEELKQFTRISRDTCSICNYGLHMCKNITHLGLCMPLNIRPFNTFKDELLSNKFTRASVLCLFRPLAPWGQKLAFEYPAVSSLILSMSQGITKSVCLTDCPAHSLSLTVTLWCARTVTLLDDDSLRKEHDRCSWITENRKEGLLTDTCCSESWVTCSFRNYQTYHDFSAMLGVEFLDRLQSIVN